MRCIWDGRGTKQSQAISEGSWDDVVSRKPRVHAVMNMEGRQPGRRGATNQRVFELVPKVPLYLPGLSASPQHSPKTISNHPPSGGSRRNSIVTGGNIGHPTQMTTSPWSSPINRHSILVDSSTPAWKRLISYTLLPHEIISLIETIFTSKDEVKAICDLRGDDAQTFINVIHEVRSFRPLVEAQFNCP